MKFKCAALLISILTVGGLIAMLNSCSAKNDKQNIESDTSGTSSETQNTPAAEPKNVGFCCTDNLTYYLRGDTLELSDKPQLKVSLAKNESEGAQLILNCPENVTELEITASDLTNSNGDVISSSNIEIFRQHYIEITSNSTEYSRTGFYPDALVPIGDQNGEYHIEAGCNQGYWFTLKTTPDTAPGEYHGEVTIKLDCGSYTVPFTAVVWDFTLPTANTYGNAYAFWYDQISAYYGGAQSPTDEEWYWFLNKYRINPTSLPVSSSDPDTFGEQAQPYILDGRVTSYNIPFYCHFGDDGELIIDEEKNERLISQLREKGLLSKGYYYLGGLIDEPSSALYGRVKTLCEYINKLAPGTPHVVTTAPSAELSGYVNTWCPLFFNENPTYKKYTDAGDGMWWYGCVGPKFPYPNYHTDTDLISKRICFWMQKDYNITGDLYWSVSIFKKYNGSEYVDRDVWNDPMAFPGAPGDGYLLYPGMKNDGIVNAAVPVPTLRLEAIRDGVEDLEYLVLLEKKVGEKLAALGLEGVVTKDEIMQSIYSQLYSKTSVINRSTSRIEEMRALIASYITENTDSLMVLGASEASDERNIAHGRLYVKAGELPSGLASLHMTGSAGNADIYEFDVEYTGEQTLFTISIENSSAEYLAGVVKDTGVKAKEYKIISETPLLGKINDDIAEKLKKNSPALKDVSVTELDGAPALRITFDSAQDWPQLNIPAKLMSETDFSKYGYLSFKLYADTNNEQLYPLYIAFSIDGNYADDGRTTADLTLGSTCEVYVHYSKFSRLTSLDSAENVAIGTWGGELRASGENKDYSVVINDIKLCEIEE